MVTKNDSEFPQHNPILHARRFFLQKAIELKPEIIDNLRDLASVEYTIFRLSNQLGRYGFNSNLLSPNNMFASTPFFKAPTWTDLKHRLDGFKLRLSLLTWTKRWRINAEWCLEYGLELVEHIYNVQESHCIFGELKHAPYHYKQIDLEMLFSERKEASLLIGFLEEVLNRHGDLPRPPQGWPEWNPIREKRQAYIQRITQKILNTIETNPYLSLVDKRRKIGLINSVINSAKQYCNKVEEHKKQANIQPIKLSRNIKRNLLWSVKFQVAGMTYSAIANEYLLKQKPKSKQKDKGRMSEGIDVATVKRSVDKTLNLIGLRKRPNSGPGRPRCSKDSLSTQITRRLGLD